MHTAAVVLEDRLGHERHRFSGLVGSVFPNVPVVHHVVSGGHQRGGLQVVFGRPASCDLVVVTFHFQAAALHGHHHFAAQVLIVVGRRHREISFLVTWTISQII